MLLDYAIRPLLRWTVGPCHPRGHKILEASIVKIQQIYGKKFDLLVCYNNTSKPQLNVQGVNYYKQTDQHNMFKITPGAVQGTAWKLCPPRLRMVAHEIIIDNDVIFYDKIAQIDNFLISKHLLGFKARHRGYSNNTTERFYVRENLLLNSGLIGLPPYFDFAKELRNKYDNQPLGRLDEQGLVASVFNDHQHKLIGFETMSPIGHEEESVVKKGIVHFIGANTANHHKAWDK